jgi:hypothetical protein
LLFLRVNLCASVPPKKGIIKYSRHQVSSLVWLAFAGSIIFESLRLPIGTWRDPGPGFLPLGTGTLLGVLSIFDFYRSRKGNAMAPKETWYPSDRWPKLFIVTASLFIYLLLWPVLGFLVSTIALLFFLFRTVEPQTWKMSVGASLLIPIAFYGIFEVWLKAQLPKGLWGF